MRPTIITGNWKMFKTRGEALSFAETLPHHVKNSQVSIYIAAPYTLIEPLALFVEKKALPYKIGAQNMHDEMQGAFTGEISASMLKDVKASFTLIGHSERRHLFRESDAFINRKIKRALAEGLQPVLCIGETLKERNAGKTEKVLEKQILQGLEGIAEIKNLILAYEPVWAIGTGRVAYPNEVESAHLVCREIIAGKFGHKAAQKLVIQYGGSVKPNNASSLLKNENVDGLLVGGASLDVKDFAEIINAYEGM